MKMMYFMANFNFLFPSPGLYLYCKAPMLFSSIKANGYCFAMFLGPVSLIFTFFDSFNLHFSCNSITYSVHISLLVSSCNKSSSYMFFAFNTGLHCLPRARPPHRSFPHIRASRSPPCQRLPEVSALHAADLYFSACRRLACFIPISFAFAFIFF